MINAVRSLTFENEFVLIYIHTGTKSTKAGGLSLAKRIYMALPASRKKNIVAVKVIQPTAYLNIRINLLTLCIDPDINRLVNTLKKFKKITAFVDELYKIDK